MSTITIKTPVVIHSSSWKNVAEHKRRQIREIKFNGLKHISNGTFSKQLYFTNTLNFIKKIYLTSIIFNSTIGNSCRSTFTRLKLTIFIRIFRVGFCIDLEANRRPCCVGTLFLLFQKPFVFSKHLHFD